jgi:hypothetical protein
MLTGAMTILENHMQRMIDHRPTPTVLIIDVAEWDWKLEKQSSLTQKS